MLIRLISKILLAILLFTIAVWVYFFVKIELEEYQPSALSEAQAKQAEEYLVGKIHPEPNGWNWGEFTTSYGVNLRYGKVTSDGAKGTVIFVPGFTGTLEMSMDVIHDLHAEGLNVAAVEYRGQGGSHRPLSNPEKGYVEDYKILAKELAEFANANRSEDLPLYFYSISKGAHITMRMAALDLVNVDAYTLIVPMIKINPAPLDYDQVAGLARLLTAAGLGDMYAPGQTQWPPQNLEFGTSHPCNANPQTAQLQSAVFHAKPELRAHGSTVKWLRETVNSSEMLLSEGFMDQLKAPVLVITAGDDRLVSTEAIQSFCQSLHDCRERHFEQARHCINPESAERRKQISKLAAEHFATSRNSSPE